MPLGFPERPEPGQLPTWHPSFTTNGGLGWRTHPDETVQLPHGHLLGPLHGLQHLLLMLLSQEGDNLSTDSTEALHNLGLLMHFNVEPVGHFIVHDIMSLHFRLLTGQLLTFQLEAVVLSLKKLEFLFDAVADL